jgi:uncharacterized protein (TIGR03084 family)
METQMAMDDEQFASLPRDLAEETADLVAALSRPSPAQWALATPAEGWNIHDQVVHLAYFDDLATLGFTQPEAFTAAVDALLATGRDWIDQINHTSALLDPEATLRWFTESRAALSRVFAEVGPGARSQWFGPSMSAASSATARLMETWAHGQDITAGQWLQIAQAFAGTTGGGRRPGQFTGQFTEDESSP